ncbi:MAG: (2Fe-2S)-binding protein [Hyphomicrobiales bacterium]|nr:MAG: (2Fe-2S)-binding protein [Hyphomicrobiales bacterium]
MHDPTPEAGKARHAISLTVNGTAHAVDVDPRQHLGDFLRQTLQLTGTHLGCEHGVCGACTVIVDGAPVRACLILAVQADGASVTTVEGLAGKEGALHPIQSAFRAHHGLQCGFCTPGMLTTLAAFLADNTSPTEAEVREAISGNLCRCTGYQTIVEAALSAAQTLRGEG